jgi:hypothetical protein
MAVAAEAVQQQHPIAAIAVGPTPALVGERDRSETFARLQRQGPIAEQPGEATLARGITLPPSAMACRSAADGEERIGCAVTGDLLDLEAIGHGGVGGRCGPLIFGALADNHGIPGDKCVYPGWPE